MGLCLGEKNVYPSQNILLPHVVMWTLSTQENRAINFYLIFKVQKKIKSGPVSFSRLQGSSSQVSEIELAIINIFYIYDKGTEEEASIIELRTNIFLF